MKLRSPWSKYVSIGLAARSLQLTPHRRERHAHGNRACLRSHRLPLPSLARDRYRLARLPYVRHANVRPR